MFINKGKLPSLNIYRKIFTSIKLNAKLIDGRKMADEVLKEVKEEVESWVKLGKKRPHLAAILVGDDPASRTYVKNKMKAAFLTGIRSQTINFESSISEEDLCSEINQMNLNSDIDGLLVQLPLPSHINERSVCNMVTPEKDVDGFHIVNVGRYCMNQESIVPATPAGVVELIKRAQIETKGKNIVVCGRSKNVGMPISMLLHSSGHGDATVTICHRHTPPEQLKSFTSNADLLVVATGIEKLITKDMVKEGVIVIDVGVNQVIDPISKKMKLVGDVDFDGVKEKASMITPVPGGVGPMTVAMLMKNTIRVAKKEIQYNHFWGLTPFVFPKKVKINSLH